MYREGRQLWFRTPSQSDRAKVKGQSNTEHVGEGGGHSMCPLIGCVRECLGGFCSVARGTLGHETFLYVHKVLQSGAALEVVSGLEDNNEMSVKTNKR